MAELYYLEEFVGDGNGIRRFDLVSLPMLVGRTTECDIQLPTGLISREHARIFRDDGAIWVVDLGSTNGTFVNCEPINVATALYAGDVVHFADQEFRVGVDKGAEDVPAMDATMAGLLTLPMRFPRKGKQFFELLTYRRVTGYRQCIVGRDGALHGYELLGRGLHGELAQSPQELFSLAASFGSEVEISFSELLREVSFRQAAEAGFAVPLFFNTHPKECSKPERLLKHLDQLRQRYPTLNLVLEIHEKAITDLAAMARIRADLRVLSIGLAYDDFGAGQARLRELIEVPPDYLKYDTTIIAALNGSASPTYKLLGMLQTLLQDMGITTLAEGVEDADTAALCHDLRVDLMQGYLFGRPEPIIETKPRTAVQTMS